MSQQIRFIWAYPSRKRIICLGCVKVCRSSTYLFLMNALQLLCVPACAFILSSGFRYPWAIYTPYQKNADRVQNIGSKEEGKTIGNDSPWWETILHGGNPFSTVGTISHGWESFSTVPFPPCQASRHPSIGRWPPAASRRRGEGRGYPYGWVSGG